MNVASQSVHSGLLIAEMELAVVRAELRAGTYAPIRELPDLPLSEQHRLEENDAEREGTEIYTSGYPIL